MIPPSYHKVSFRFLFKIVSLVFFTWGHQWISFHCDGVCHSELFSFWIIDISNSSHNPKSKKIGLWRPYLRVFLKIHNLATLTQNLLSYKHLLVYHTSQDSFYKWTKISSLEIDIFGLKWARIFFLKFTEPLQRYLLTCQANSAFLGRFFCTGQQQLWRGSVNFKIKSLDHFLPSFLVHL